MSRLSGMEQSEPPQSNARSVTKLKLDLAALPPATKRGKGFCQGEGCVFSYPCRKKPDVCPKCGYYLGGSAQGCSKEDTSVSFATKLKAGNLSENYDLYSVKIARRGRDYRCFVQVSHNDSSHICYYSKCHIQRSTAMLSNSSKFECEHVKAAQQSNEEAEELPLVHSALASLPFPSGMKEELNVFVQRAAESKVPAVQHASLSNYVIICDKTHSNPLGLLHLRVDHKESKFTCGEDGSRTSAKPYRSRCVHYCLYKWASANSNPAVVTAIEALQAQYTDDTNTVSTDTRATASPNKTTQRKSTIQLLRNLVKIPEDSSSLTPIFKLIELKNAGTTTLLNSMNSGKRVELHLSEIGWRMFYGPEEQECQLCGTALSEPLQVQGSNGEGWMVTMTHILPIKCRVKKCPNQACLAIHGYHDIKSGLFNITNKILVSLDIMFLIREHVKQGTAPLHAVEAILSMTLAKSPAAAAKITTEKRRYIEQCLFRGYWAYECLTVRNTDDAICGLCGIAPKVEIAESNNKDCVSLSGIKIQWPESPPMIEEPVDVDGFWAEMEDKTLEQVAFASVDLLSSYDGTRVAPYISPALRADKVLNTESLKSPGRSAGSAIGTPFQGNPSKLAEMVQQGTLVPGQLPQYSHPELFSLCQRCDIPVSPTDSKVMLQNYLEEGCQFLSAGRSACHAFSSSTFNSGGCVSKTCPHQVVMASKFLLRQESSRDHVDLLQSCKYWPPVYLADMACSMAQHASFRYPALARQMWGDTQGCFQPPIPYQEPQPVFCPELQMTELQSNPTPLVEPNDPLTHPATGRKERRILTAHISDKGGAHQLKSCDYHNMDLCSDLAPYKSSLLSSRGQGTRPRDSRRKGSLSFHQYFLYGRLMDYFSNLAIVRGQLELISKQCITGETIVRDKRQRFVIVCSKCYYGGHVAKDCPYNAAR